MSAVPAVVVVAKTSVQVEFLYVEWRLRCPLRLQRVFVLTIEAAVTWKTETYSYFPAWWISCVSGGVTRRADHLTRLCEALR